MAGELNSKPLGDLCDPERGITYGIVKVGDYVVGGIPVIRGGDIREGRIVFDGEKRVTEEVSQQFKRTILKGGEILVNLIAEPGHTAIVPPALAGANVSRDVAVIALNDEVDHKYVDYCLKSPMAVNWLRARLQGSVTQKINLGTLRDLPIPTRPRDEQRAISHILGTLDRKLELNRMMNETLAAIARALFKSWFVDFDPLRAKAEKRDPGVPRTLADLFPSSFEQSEVDDIPQGWKVVGLDEIGRFLNGLALQKFPPQDGRFLPVIKIAQLRSEDTSDADKASADLASDYVVNDGDVLFSWSGSLECILWASGKGALNQHLFKVTSDVYPKWFYFLWIGEHLEEFRHIAAGKATTMGHIQRGHLSAAKVLIPAAELLNEMTHHFAPLINQIVQLKIASKTLSAIRDALLPKLISGDLCVPDVERIMGGVM
jgi:type I restriction enzyme S subunit